MPPVIGLPLLLSLLITSPAWAGSAEDVAVRASEVQEQYCADLVDSNVTLRAGSLREVAEVWEAVSRAYDASPELYLLYWRGALAQCLGGFDDTARTDLQAFWRASVDDPGLAEQRRDAERRLRRLGEAVGPNEPQGRPGLGLGIGLLAGGGVVAGLAGWQRSVLSEAEAAYTALGVSGESRDAAQVEGADAATATNILLSAGIGLGAAAVPMWVVDGVLAARRTTRRASLVPVGAPTPAGGVVFGVAGRW